MTDDELQALAAFVQDRVDLYVTGIREDKDGWWAVVRKWVGSGMPAEEVVKHGPYTTQTEALAEAEAWGKEKAKTYNVFK